MWRQPGDPDVIRHVAVTCPYCGKNLNAAADPDSKLTPPPKQGDFALCFGCARPSVYQVHALTGEVTLREATQEEHDECTKANAATINRLKAFLLRNI
jgi:hypothetical protein